MVRSNSPTSTDEAITELIGALPTAQARALTKVRSTLLRLLPGSDEAIAWGMPTVKVGPDQLLSYSGFAHHNSLFPGPGVAAAIGREFPTVTTTKGTVHFDRDEPAPASLLRRVVRLRLIEINESYPRANGRTRRYFDNGFTEYTGAIRDGQPHGAWEWFRRDGTIKRSGRFRAGQQVGEWTTYDTSGNPYRTTDKG